MKNFQLNRFAFLFLIVLVFAACKSDPCEESPCLNGATCTNVDGDAVCTCATGYEGEFCGTEWRSSVLGAYNGDYCSGTSTYTTSVTEKSGSVLEVEFSNFADYSVTYSTSQLVYGVFTSKDTINIPDQFMTDLGSTVSGKAVIGSDGKITINHKVTDQFGSLNCVDVLSK
ncbi:MAG: calcium-binding EGF-like domain-containing protein [Bacteroidia bacterium]|nr:calcium-binding EGF-like domain-containing protein [Bacteroidia bacterium]